MGLYTKLAADITEVDVIIAGGRQLAANSCVLVQSPWEVNS